jgi:hypothetical protein
MAARRLSARMPVMRASRLGGLMSAKMNWDRVRKESQARRSGSAWIGSDAVGPTAAKETKPSRRGESTGSQSSRRSKMPGCTCGKIIGFSGSHKKKCPLSNSLNLRIDSSSNRNSFSECIKKAGRLPSTREFLLSLETAIELARSFPEQDRQGALKLIRALLESLAGTPVQKPKPNGRRMLSDDQAS